MEPGHIEPGYIMGSLKKNPPPHAWRNQSDGCAMGNGLQNTPQRAVEGGMERIATRVLTLHRTGLPRGQLWPRVAGGLLIRLP